jgi:SAM-dependent methyltransferase
MNCRHCGNKLILTFLDLGHAPPSNAYRTLEELSQPERYYPLKIKVCEQCWLVQTEDYAQADELFSPDYAYFSSTSSGWLAHAEHYSKQITERLSLNKNSLVIEVASNDGYLLKNFVESGIPCLGVEPTTSTATAAEKLGVPVVREFFGEKLGKRLASEGKSADLIVGNNVFAHVPNINDFTKGLKSVLRPGGTITLEFPHLMQLINHVQFDTVYHEHFSYLSLYTVSQIFQTAGLRVMDVEELPTHGGSLRVYGCHAEDPRMTAKSVGRILRLEDDEGMQHFERYASFQSQADKIKDQFLSFLIQQKQAKRKIVAYGAAAKGNTLLNYAGVKRDLLPFVCDAAPAKQGKFMPGSQIPILPPNEIYKCRPDFVLILPWNIADEIIEENHVIREWGGKFVTSVPELRIT